MEYNVTGLWGEIYASRYLRDEGYNIMAANYRTRHGEIDVVAADKQCIAFVEVKTRGENMIAPPGESVTEEKQRKLSAAAAQYLASYPTDRVPRFDVVEIFVGNGNSLIEINHIKSAFEAVTL